jgi:hypothetical protein
MLGDLLDQVLLGKESQSAACKRHLDVQAVRHDSGGDETPCGHLLQQLVVAGLVEHGQVLQLVADLTLAPLLLVHKAKQTNENKQTRKDVSTAMDMSKEKTRASSIVITYPPRSPRCYS